jgi:hypothetical protein
VFGFFVSVFLRSIHVVAHFLLSILPELWGIKEDWAKGLGVEVEDAMSQPETWAVFSAVRLETENCSQVEHCS